MLTIPIYQISTEILETIAKIDAVRLYFSSLDIVPELKLKIQRISLLRSSLFSARIEGNPLRPEDFEVASDEQKKIEVYNIEKAAISIINKIKAKSQIDTYLISGIHRIVMENLSHDSGRLRNEVNAIFDQSGIAVYMPPPPERIKDYLNDLYGYVNSSSEKFPLIKAFITHLFFEKIHPFMDGNGRVGRLLIYAVLKSCNYDFGFYIPFEEYLDNHKSDYYYFLDHGLKNTNDYLVFMLNAFLDRVEELRERLGTEMKKKETIFLPPRQEEIYDIVKDHRVVSFDFIRRRFLKVPARTLRYDVKKLTEKNLLVKTGKTKGSFYRVKM